MRIEAGVDADVAQLIRAWAARWGVPGLETQVTVAYSARLRRSLGRCSPSSGRIVLHPELRGSAPARLAEVLCHEVAHVAAYRLHGRTVRPHGPEWRQLVQDAGYRPELRAPGADVPAPRRTQARPRTLAYEHRCPVCHAVRLARRPVPRWRCAECVAAGLGGEMVITRRATERGNE